MSTRTCAAIKQDGHPCKQAPRLDHDLCFWHDPECADEADAARRLGGQRRKREGTLGAAFDFRGINSPEDLIRLLDIAAFDALAMDGAAQKVSSIVRIVQAGAKLFETKTLDERLAAIESVVLPRKEDPENQRKKR